MKRQAYQHPELRDANDNIIQEGTYGKESPLVNSDNTGVLDYINNNLEALYDNINADVLLKSGGTMTGTLTLGTNAKARGLMAQNGTSCFRIASGEFSYNNSGAFIHLFSQTADNNAGNFQISAHNSSNEKALVGKPDGTLTWGGQPLLPVGVVQAYAGTTIPTGWLLCDGSAVSRTDYAALYAVIGTTYGDGDRSTTFNLPNLTDKFIQGSAKAGTVKSAGLPNIKGAFGNIGSKSGSHFGLRTDNAYAYGAFFIDASATGNTTDFKIEASSTATREISFDSSKSNSIYGNSTTVQPPALTMRYIIKY